MFRQPKPEPQTTSQRLTRFVLPVAVVALLGIIVVHFLPAVSTDMDFAALANGARIMDEHSSASFNNLVEQRVRSFSKHYNYPEEVPDAALRLMTGPPAPWMTNGTKGVLAIRLSSPAFIASFKLKPYSPPSTCSPRELRIWGLVTSSDYVVPPLLTAWPTSLPMKLFQPRHIVEPVSLLKRSWDLFLSVFVQRPSRTMHWRPLETVDYLQLSDTAVLRDVSLDLDFPLHAVAIEFIQNWGASFTCFAGFGAYGPETSTRSSSCYFCSTQLMTTTVWDPSSL
ncbi:hypothetical protein EXIGLDRAFT_744157 [Exidia glandulosa HHB12029]|uniref:SUN domain-containing protein n=1 Tax=Exidia glandulosa HHB12029 TaxID=1314781 RepID=A0A165QB47_EXIGL|nr:hypothetical protein EXIGLDRAFT_744157 [Exidia glandulosa HHB12029]